MMKRILSICALLMSATLVQSQDQESGFQPAPPQDVRPIRLGFVATPAMTWLTAENRELDSKGVRGGFSFGVMMDFTIAQSANYAFSTGLMYNTLDGGRLRHGDVVPLRGGNPGEFEAVTRDVSLSMQYVQIPMTLKLKTNEIGYMSYFGQLGMQAGLNIGSRENGEFEYFDNPQRVIIERENANDQTQLFNAGLLVGIGAEYNVTGNTYLVFGVNYYRGFSNVLKGNVVQVNEDGRPLINEDGLPLSGGKRRAVLSNIALNLAVIF